MKITNLYCNSIDIYSRGMKSCIDIHTHNPEGNGVSVLNLYGHFELAQNGMLCSIGIHPWYIDDNSFDSRFAEVRRFAILSNVVAIGECGLDKVTDTDWALQIKAFAAQILLANELQKPLVIHCVRAFDEVLGLLKEKQVQVPVVFHGFNKNVQVARRILDSGYYLSFGAALLEEQSPAVAALQECPENKFFLETDDADVNIIRIYEKVADIRKTETDALILQLQKNFHAVFNI